MDVKPIVLDHNFPEPLLRAIAGFVPDLKFIWIRSLAGDLHLLPDDELVYELFRRACPVLVTLDARMLDDPQVLVAIDQTRMTVVAIAESGHDPIRATGVLLRDLLDIVRRDEHRGLTYRVQPSRPQPTPARDLFARVDLDFAEAQRTFGLPFAERRKYPDDDPRRLR